MTLVLSATVATATNTVALDYEEEKLFMCSGDCDLIFTDANAWGSNADLTLTKLSYDNSTNLSFYNVVSNNVSHKITPDIFAGIIHYEYECNSNIYTIAVDYSTLDIPKDPRIVALENELANRSETIANLTAELNTTNSQLDTFRAMDIKSLHTTIAEQNSTIATLQTQLATKTSRLANLSDVEEQVEQLRVDKATFNSTLQRYQTRMQEAEAIATALKDPLAVGYPDRDAFGSRQDAVYINVPSMLLGAMLCAALIVVFVFRRDETFAALDILFTRLHSSSSRMRKYENYPNRKIKDIERIYLDDEKRKDKQHDTTATPTTSPSRQASHNKHDDIIGRLDKLPSPEESTEEKSE